MSEEPVKKHLHVFCDESQTSGARYMVYGGIIVPWRQLEPFAAAMAEFRQRRSMNAELKWVKVSAAKYDDYAALVDLFFEFARADRMHFKSVVFDTQQIDYRTYHGGDREIGFYKFFYTFLLHKFCCYAKTDDYRLFVNLDQRETKYKLAHLCSVLKNGTKQKFGLSPDVIRQVEARDSKKTDLLQVADVLMGAIGWHQNALGERPGARQAKSQLAAHVARRAGRPSLKTPTPYGAKLFEIWCFDFGKTRRKK